MVDELVPPLGRPVLVLVSYMAATVSVREFSVKDTKESSVSQAVPLR